MGLGIKSYLFYDLNFGKNIKSVSLKEFFPGNQLEVNMHGLVSAQAGMSESEAVQLMRLAKHSKGLNVFEIGTFFGVTAYGFAANLPQAKVYTLDLPSDQIKTKLPVTPADHDYMGTANSNHYWNGKPESGRITSLRGDSAVFDFHPYENSMDVVFVDGAHSYDYVCKDSESALAMVRKDGFVVWHDYAPCWPGVVKCLNGLSRKNALYHVKNTSLVFFRKG